MHEEEPVLHQIQQRDYWPTRGWKTKTPQEVSVNPEQLTQLHEYAESIATLHSILIVRSGYVNFEHYYHGWSHNKYHNVNSVTKSVTSALVGIALRESYLHDLDQPLLTFFPEYTPSTLDPRKQAITLRHLLSMSSGFQISPQGVETFLDDTSSPEKMLDRPLLHTPGEVYGYDEVSCHFLSLVLNQVTKMSLATYAQTRLFEPLGIWQDKQGTLYPWTSGTYVADAPHPFALWSGQENTLWSVDVRDYHTAGMGLQLTTREMAKFGYLYLNRGWWNGQNIIPEDYVQASWTQHSITPRDEGYGYLWFLPQWHGHTTNCAVGYGGQVIAVVPDSDLVVVITSHPELGPAQPKIILKDFVIPAVEQVK